MATLEELRAERARREAQGTPELTPNAEMRRQEPTTNPVTIDGVPFDDFHEKNNLPTNERLNALKAERMRREAGESAPPFDPINREPMPTGIEEIDNAGGSTTRYVGPRDRAVVTDHPARADMPFDSEVAIKAELAAQGVDFSSGAPAGIRSAMAQSTTIPRLQENALKAAIKSAGINGPEGQDILKYSPRLDEFFMLMPDQENEGKWRYTAMDGAGLEMGDWGDAMDPAEVISMVGSVGATFLDPTKGVGKVFSLGAKSVGRSAAVRGFTGGLSGRVVGNLAEISLNYMRTGDYPTWDEMVDEGYDAAVIEGFASITGELGSKILRTGSNLLQDAAARATGRVGAHGTAEEIARANKNVRETQADMSRVRDATGREDFAVTQGTATHSIDMIERENFGVANASKGTQRTFNAARAKTERATQDYVDNVFRGDREFFEDRGTTIIAANDAISGHGKIAIAQTDDGIVHFAPKIQPDYGIKVKVEGDVWQIRGAKLKEAGGDGADLTGTGLGQELYETAAMEAGSYGKPLVSDIKVSQDAVAVWKRMDGGDATGDLVWNKNVTEFTDGNGRVWLESTDGLPVVGMKPPSAVTPVLLEEFNKLGRGEGGKFVAAKEFTRFLRRPGQRELGTVVEEMSSNPFIKQDVKEAIFKDFERNTKGENGVLNEELWDQWKDETGRVLEEVFSPAEMVVIRTQPDGLRTVVAAQRGQTELTNGALARSLGLDRGSVMLKDNKAIWGQMKGRTRQERLRTMKILDASDQATGSNSGQAIRSIFKEELKLDLMTKIKGTNEAGYNKWLQEHRDLIRDMTGTEFYNDLRTVGHILKRKSDRAMVTGSGADANPTGLALTRVLFGPLSRTQRFFSAARRGQVRGSGASASELITDPAALRELMKIRVMPLTSRAAAKVIQDLGVVEQFWFDADRFDADNPEHRARIAANVSIALQEEMDLAGRTSQRFMNE